MNTEKELMARSGGICELCGSSEELSVFEVAPSEDGVLVCSVCSSQIQNPESMDENHFNCLNDSMWSEVPAVKALSYRLLNSLGRQDLSETIYFEDSEKIWADALVNSSSSNATVRDSNGVLLSAGDSVVIIKDLEVKGAGFTAKRGTIVKNISIPSDVEGHIEGRVNGTKIYLKTEFLKKA